MLGEGASPAPAPPETGVVEPPAVHLPEPPEHLVAPVGEVLLQPFGEQFPHSERQPQQHHPRVRSARLARSAENLR